MGGNFPLKFYLLKKKDIGKIQRQYQSHCGIELDGGAWCVTNILMLLASPDAETISMKSELNCIN
eukprot:15366077-Ditylum_brightwellii.AAC.1